MALLYEKYYNILFRITPSDDFFFNQFLDIFSLFLLKKKKRKEGIIEIYKEFTLPFSSR